MRLRRCAAGAIGLLALLPLVTACGEDEGGVAIGDVVPARQDSQFSEGDRSWLNLPVGRLEVFLGEPTDRLEADDTRQLEAVDAPDGGSFVPLTWQYDAATFGRNAQYLGEEVTPRVDLKVDGASYRLPAPDQTGEGASSFYVLVSGNTDTPSLEIDFDGATQTLDLATGERDEGAASALYDLKPTARKTRSCTEQAVFKPASPRRLPSFRCSITAPVLLPYAGGEWAPEGTSWLAVTVTTSLLRYDQIGADLRSGATYYAAGADTTFRRGGQEPALVLEDRGRTECPDANAGCTTSHHVIFESKGAKSDRLVTTQKLKLALASTMGGADSPDDQVVTATISSRLR